MDDHPEICSFCHIGHIVEKKITYTEWYQEELVVIPGIPAKICDYCGEQEFDPFIVGTLHRLLWAGFDMSRDITMGRRIRRHRYDIPEQPSKDTFTPNE